MLSHLTLSELNKSSPKSFEKSALLPSWQRMDWPALCATSCTIPTADETNHSATGTLHPHANARCVQYVILHCLITPIPSKIVSSLTGDINSQSSQMEQWKMKIAYNTAYVQIETVNFTFAQPSKLSLCIFYICSNFQDIAMPNVKIKLRVAHCRQLSFFQCFNGNFWGLYLQLGRGKFL